MSAIDTIGGGNIEPRGLEEEMRSAYLDYAMSVIVGRALPDVRDGLKPVHRRVLYVMNELGLNPGRNHGNCGNIGGSSAAAMRYTEARLDRLATEMLRALDADTVDFMPTYDGTRQ